MIIALTFVLAIICIGLARYLDNRQHSDAPIAFFMSGALVALVSVIMVIGCACAKFSVPADLAEVAELRRIAQAIDLNASEDIAGKVADFNVSLASRQWWNRNVWGDPFIPDEWDTVRVIAVPERP